MSPASSGALEVERYIGACLISSQTRSKGGPSKPHGRDQFFQRDHFLPRYVNNNHHHPLQRCRSVDGWAGGMPLISFASYQRRNKAVQDTRVSEHHNPLSRLAVHTQGAPLILASKYNHRKNKTAGRNFMQSKTTDNNKPKDSQGADTVSVNSDESSASTNSENSLPRIIKPRKRRKKDRKPPHLARPLGVDDCFSTDSASPDIDSPPGIITIGQYLPFAFEQYHYTSSDSLGANIHNNNNNNSVPISKVKIKSDLQETPKLHHSFEDVEDFSKDINDNQPASSCQCRYCDPSGQIWDVDRHCYSPFLTTPERQSTFSFPDIQVEPLVRGYEASLSSELIDCMTGLSLDVERTKSDSSISGSSRDLEVSTEIVTSLNGHRDLEIKFFSSSTSPDPSKRGTVRSLSLDESRCRSDNELSVVVNNKSSSLGLEQ